MPKHMASARVRVRITVLRDNNKKQIKLNNFGENKISDMRHTRICIEYEYAHQKRPIEW